MSADDEESGPRNGNADIAGARASLVLPRADPALSSLKFDGERYIPGAGSAEMALEHFHRYLLAASIAEGKIVVDIASGEGYGTDLLAQRAANALGVDISVEAVAAARARYARPNLRFEVGECQNIPVESGAADLVVSFETLEHIAQPEAFLDEARRILKPDGVLIISTPDKPIYDSELEEPNPHHVHEVDRATFEAMLRARFRNVRMLGQRVVFGSAVIAREFASGESMDIIDQDRETSRLRQVPFTDRAVYCLALCGDGPLPSLRGGVYGGGLPPNAVSSLIGGIRERDARIREMTEALDAESKAHAAALERLGDQSGLATAVAEMAVAAALSRLQAAEAALAARADDLASREEGWSAAADRRGAPQAARFLREELERTAAARETIAALDEQVMAAREALARARSRENLLREENDRLAAAADAVRAEMSALRAQLQAAQEAAARDSAALAERGARESGLAEQLAEARARLQQAENANLNLAASAQAKRAKPLLVQHAAAFARRARTHGLRAGMRGLQWAILLRRAGAVDAEFYRRLYPDVATRGADPVLHYVFYGADEGRDPNPTFSTGGYVALNGDVRRSGVNPLFHYLRHGRAEGRAAGAALMPPLPAPAPVPSPSPAPAAAIEPIGLPPWPQAPEPAPPAPLGWPIPAPAVRRPARPPRDDLYAVRPDEECAAEARRGAEFISAFALDSERADFAGAAEAINRLSAGMRIIESGAEETPDASIIVPAYGQLGYTLNCLHALLAHRSRFTAEIILFDDCSADATPRIAPLLSRIRYRRAQENCGFLAACNSAAEMARGRFIVLLNNDTRVMPGWLDELIGAFDVLPNAGLVGSKLLYPDGTLQEAGGVIWRNGSAWNYGRNDDPNRPEYCYARQVDYVSGASIAVPAALWRALGGFDTIYRPAYCEDSDLALRVRHQAGRAVYMQPLSRVIHYEGKTSGTDVTRGVKQYQVENSRKLFARWRTALAAHRPMGDSAVLEKDRGCTKRALFIDLTTPTPDQDAGSITAFVTMALLQRAGYKVTFAPDDNYLFHPPYTEDLQRIGVECLYAPYDYPLEAHLRRHGHLYDVVIMCRMTTAQRALDLVRQFAPQATAIFHNMDLHFLRMSRQAALSNDRKLLDQAKKAKVSEFRIISQADCTLVPSEMEQNLLRAELPAACVVHLPYVVDCVDSDVPFGARRDYLFVGGFRHSPNVDAVLHFVRDVWPHLRARTPGAKFYAIGAAPPPEVLALQCQDVVVTGHVEDLRPWFDKARVFVAPIRYGAGVKGKVSSAMAHALPIVGTAQAFEGMPGFIAGEHALAADDPVAFAKACALVYTDAALWERLSRASYRYCVERNSLEAAAAGLEHALGEARRTQSARSPRVATLT